MYQRVLFVALGFVAAIGTAIVYFVGGNLAISGTIGVGTIAAFAVYVSQIYQPLTQLANARVDVLTALGVVRAGVRGARLPAARRRAPGRGRPRRPDASAATPGAAGTSRSTTCGSATRRRRPRRSRSLEETHGATDLDDESAWILHDVSFTVEPGELVALVGPSGAGKTTTALLVPRIHDVTPGAVRVDGHDVRDLTLESLRGAVGMVMQDPHLFHDTVRNNLRYANPDATDDELVEACRAARIHDMIASLPDGYDTLVGERGYRMSGGEKQRLAIARMLLKDPAVVILDEATSHLDSESELAIQQALAEALTGRTSLVIAHRLSTIVAADRILVIEGGRVVESGRHEELLDAGGLYTDLYRTQLSHPAAELADRDRHEGSPRVPASLAECRTCPTLPPTDRRRQVAALAALVTAVATVVVAVVPSGRSGTTSSSRSCASSSPWSPRGTCSPPRGPPRARRGRARRRHRRCGRVPRRRTRPAPDRRGRGRSRSPPPVWPATRSRVDRASLRDAAPPGVAVAAGGSSRAALQPEVGRREGRRRVRGRGRGPRHPRRRPHPSTRPRAARPRRDRRAAPTSWASRAATARRRWSPASPRSTTCRSCASRPVPATTSRSTSASTATTSSAHSTRSPRATNGASTSRR